MNAVKSQLEATLDELEDTLAREKTARAGVDKARRKVEGDLRITQEMVLDLERAKKDLETNVARKEKDFDQLVNYWKTFDKI